MLKSKQNLESSPVSVWNQFLQQPGPKGNSTYFQWENKQVMEDPADTLPVLNAKRTPKRGFNGWDLVPCTASIHVKNFAVYEPGTVISVSTLVFFPDAQ